MCLTEGIVTNTVRSYINLNNAEAIKHYNGPVHFMRREMDEVMNIGRLVELFSCQPLHDYKIWWGAALCKQVWLKWKMIFHVALRLYSFCTATQDLTSRWFKIDKYKKQQVISPDCGVNCRMSEWFEILEVIIYLGEAPVCPIPSFVWATLVL